MCMGDGECQNGSEFSNRARQGYVLSPLLLFDIFFAAVLTVGLQHCSKSAETDALADLVHVDESVPQGGLRRKRRRR